MGQEPNIDIAFEDQPREELRPAVPRRWHADRPGDLKSPDQVPWGGPFGTPGPDTGYALKLASGADMKLEPGEDRGNVERAMVHLMAARASHFGRAPTNEDLKVAMLLLGLASPDQVPEATMRQLSRDRKYWAPRVVRSSAAARQMVARVPPGLLGVSLEDVRHRLALGEIPLGR